MTATADVVYLADHSVVLAIPAVLPALIIVAAVLYVVRKDRAEERAEQLERDGDED